ncbi:hypothetical protein K2173_022711 [Erythroxylum novogranatense]|uniref:beta-carotene 3-hydroxylase n=1 Tax=Erythroxylum novogranatense TaxID=1862640 RepID=A0AAV8TNU0_9ROSI|nr:hypothetical protein K2173_022711 [Erythroxylum novogranatense]
MAASISATSSSLLYCFQRCYFASIESKSMSLNLATHLQRKAFALGKRQRLVICSVTEQRKEEGGNAVYEGDYLSGDHVAVNKKYVREYSSLVEMRLARKRSERYTYLVAAILSSFGISLMALMSVYYRFSWQVEGGEVPILELFGTCALSVGAAVGMEYWARWAHKALWHSSLWNMHESHHRPRNGAFELNDVFAVINAVPAIALMSYGFYNKGLVPGLCFGAGLGITMFGMAYMFVHDGLVHRRFPVGPVANVPYLRRVAAAHQFHHSEKFGGVPYGLFLGPQEVEAAGGTEELAKEVQRRIKQSQRN